MKGEQIPFMHFMARVEVGRETRLLTPCEAEENVGGQFFVPVAEEDGLFPVYQFHYSMYLGNGLHQPIGQGGKPLRGFGFTFPQEQRTHVLLTFEPMPPGPESRLPRGLRTPRGEFLMPVLRRVPRQMPIRYGGTTKHRDFEHLFAELEPTEPQLLDRLLDEFRISIIGCARQDVRTRS